MKTVERDALRPHPAEDEAAGGLALPLHAAAAGRAGEGHHHARGGGDAVPGPRAAPEPRVHGAGPGREALRALPGIRVPGHLAPERGAGGRGGGGDVGAAPGGLHHQHAPGPRALPEQGVLRAAHDGRGRAEGLPEGGAGERVPDRRLQGPARGGDGLPRVPDGGRAPRQAVGLLQGPRRRDAHRRLQRGQPGRQRHRRREHGHRDGRGAGGGPAGRGAGGGLLRRRRGHEQRHRPRVDELLDPGPVQARAARHLLRGEQPVRLHRPAEGGGDRRRVPLAAGPRLQRRGHARGDDLRHERAGGAGRARGGRRRCA